MILKAFTWLALLSVAGCAETREDSFSSMSTPEARSMMSRGWIPAVLPSTATDVRVRSNIDTNMVRGTARIPEPDLPALLAAVRPLAGNAVALLDKGHRYTSMVASGSSATKTHGGVTRARLGGVLGAGATGHVHGPSAVGGQSVLLE